MDLTDRSKSAKRLQLRVRLITEVAITGEAIITDRPTAISAEHFKSGELELVPVITKIFKGRLT